MAIAKMSAKRKNILVVNKYMWCIGIINRFVSPVVKIAGYFYVAAQGDVILWKIKVTVNYIGQGT